MQQKNILIRNMYNSVDFWSSSQQRYKPQLTLSSWAVTTRKTSSTTKNSGFNVRVSVHR
jgi:hypothetical protein